MKMLNNFAILFAIAALGVFILWLGTGKPWGASQHFFEMLYLCRFPLFATVLLLLLALVRRKEVQALLGGLVQLEWPRMVVACIATTLLAVSIAKTLRTILENSESRFDTGDFSGGMLAGICSMPTLVPSLSWLQLLPAIPLLTALAINSIDHSDHARANKLFRAGAASLSFAGTLLLIIGILPWFDIFVTGTARLMEGVSPNVKKWIGPGYFDALTGKLDEGHLQSTGFLAMFLSLYAAGYFVLHPKHSARLDDGQRVRWRARVQRMVPPIYYVLLMLTIFVWLLSGMSFLLDYWRISTLIVLGLFSYAAYRWILYDHYFTTTNNFTTTNFDDSVTKKEQAKLSGRNGNRSDTANSLAAAHDFNYVQHSSSAKDRRRSANEKQEKIPQVRLEKLTSNDCLVVVTAYGGGILAGAWLNLVLGRLYKYFEHLQKNTALISSVSGGSVGTLFVIDRMLQANKHVKKGSTMELANCAIRTSSLEATAWGLAYPGLIRMLVPAIVWEPVYDHGWATEKAWQNQMANPDLTLGQAAQAFRDGRCPQVIMNSVCVENGRRFLFSSGIDQKEGEQKPNTVNQSQVENKERFDFFGTYKDRDIPLVTAARMSATFPYVSPIARIDHEPKTPAWHFADGGYFDNFGVFSAVEWIREQLEKPDSVLKKNGLKKILVLKICSAPREKELTGLRVGWFNNLFGPLLTLMSVRGASQAERVETELNDFSYWCRKQHGITLETASFEHSGEGPLSWELKPYDVKQLQDYWDQKYQPAIDKLLTAQKVKKSRVVADPKADATVENPLVESSDIQIERIIWSRKSKSTDLEGGSARPTADS